MKDYAVSCARMKELEKQTDEAGLSYYYMMENAGTIAANRIVEITMASPINDAVLGADGGADRDADGADQESRLYPWALDRPLRARVYCGKGNNGGDGFVVARLLAEGGWTVQIVLVDGEPTTPDAIENYRLVREMGLPLSGQAGSEPASEKNRQTVPDVVVDAIYGTGFHGQLRPDGAAAAEEIAGLRGKGAVVFALDIPSGMGGDLTDEEELDRRCVRADHTITFHAKKAVHLQDFARDYCGDIIVADIGIVDPDRPGQGSACDCDLTEGEPHDFADFVEVVARLRAPDGCVWDRAQTHETLKKYLTEETQEVLEAIDQGDDDNLCEELGDVLLQVVLHAQIASETGRFTIDDVVQVISDKMIRRHPWVFGDVEINSIEENVNLWEEIEKKEKAQKK